MSAVETQFEILQAFGELSSTWGFSVTEPGEAQRPIANGRQRLHCHVQQKKNHWTISLMARTSFFLDDGVDEQSCSFRTSAHFLDPSFPAEWSFAPHRNDVAVEGLRTAYEGQLEPYLAATQTPAGMVRWLCETYQPMRLICPSLTRPLRHGLWLTQSLPSDERYAARICLREKIIVIAQIMN